MKKHANLVLFILECIVIDTLHLIWILDLHRTSTVMSFIICLLILNTLFRDYLFQRAHFRTQLFIHTFISLILYTAACFFFRSPLCLVVALFVLLIGAIEWKTSYFSKRAEK